MVVYIAPLGAGSGIPELKSYLNGVRVPGFLALNTLFVKAIGVAFSISAGLISGKQGPMIHAGAIIGAGMSQAASTRFRWRWNTPIFRFLRTEAWKRDFSAVGAAIGVAVAFGAPMGAWMWVYEEACTHWTWSLGIITLGGCLTGSAIVRILNYLAAGLPSGFGSFTLTQFGKLVTPFDGAAFPLKDIPAFILIGVLGGVVGALLPFLNKRITLFRYKHVTKRIPRLFETALIAALTAITRIVVPYLAGSCRDSSPEIEAALENAPLQDFSQFTCSSTQYSPWAAVMYNPSDSVVRALLFARGPGIFPAGAVAASFVYYFVFIVWTYGIAVPSGVFFPGFLLGSVYGRLIGIAVQAIFPARTDISLTGFAFVGAVSALAGLTRTISVAVIAIEATGAGDSTFAAVLVAIIAKLVGDFLYGRGIYDLHIDLKGIPFLSSEVPKLESYQKLRVSDLMSTSVVGVRRLSRVAGLINMLSSNEHHAFPVFLKVINSPSSSRGVDKSSNSSRENPGTSSSGDPFFSSHDMHDLEMELEEKEANAMRRLQTRSSIITPTHVGLQATVFDEGRIRHVTIAERGDCVGKLRSGIRPPRRPRRNDDGHHLNPKWNFPTSDSDSGTRRNRGNSDEPSTGSSRESDDRDVPDFELTGTIGRDTLLALLKHECDKHEREKKGEELDEDNLVPREQLDSAWPNPARVKGDGEKDIVKRVAELDVLDRVIDLKPYIDPNPLLMSDRALPITAYHLFRRTGARHILVVDMRSGRVCGIMTRKDILLESITDILEQLQDIKVE